MTPLPIWTPATRESAGYLETDAPRRQAEDKAALFAFAWRVCEHHGLPGPIPEFVFASPRRWRFDFAWPADSGGGVAVEVDGGQWKPGGGKHGSDADREKLNFAAKSGWLVLRFSPRQLRDAPAGCVEQVVDALTLVGPRE